MTDVAPRDGLQNEPLGPDGAPIPAMEKARLVELISRMGVDEVEVTSFVSPKWIPQLADAAEVCDLLTGQKPAEVAFSALVPNAKGMRSLLEVNERAGFPLIDKVAVFTAVSETFCQKNINATFEESLERFRPVASEAVAHGLSLRAYLSCAIACPFEGEQAPEAVADAAVRLAELEGVSEVDLADTIGAGTPESVSRMLEAVQARWSGREAMLTLHLHDTFGRAAECIRAAARLGLRSFDASSGGLGGCPYASTPDGPAAPGNVSMRVLVEALEAEGIKTRVDPEHLAEAEAYAQSLRGGGGSDLGGRGSGVEA